MKEYILKNGIKLIYKHTTSELSSICIGVDAGASVDGELLGIAHATEHMVYKGTINRNEEEINKDLTDIFGFNNAMTNYPYVIYYGTLLGSDFRSGVEVLADIVQNPTFNEDGFQEEMDVIKEELKEWDEELEQYCEDKLFFNCFKKRRIKYPIIGTMESLEKIKLEDIKRFYNRFYKPSRTSIAVISALDFEVVKKVIEDYFGRWTSSEDEFFQESYEKPESACYENKKLGLGTSRIEIIFPIDKLNNEEIKALRLFNQVFGEGVNSVLFDILRTKNSLVYDVLTDISVEKHIKLYKITFNTSEDKIEKALDLVNDCIKNINKIDIDEVRIKRLVKSLRLKILFKEEQSIQLAKALSTYSVMFNDYKIYEDMLRGMEELDRDFILNVAIRVLKNKTIQIIRRGK